MERYGLGDEVADSLQAILCRKWKARVLASL